MLLEIQLDTTGIAAVLNVLIKVLLWSITIAAPFIIAILVLYGYGKYKKWNKKEEQETERIILGRAKKITQYDEELSRQADERKKLEFDLELLRNQKKRLHEELGESEEPEVPEAEENTSDEIDLTKMNIKQLKTLAKDRKIPMFSKLNKQQLLNKLQEVVVSGKLE